MAGPTLERLYKRHAEELFRYLQRRVPQVRDAEDALQETFVQAASHGDRLAAAESPRAWLFGVARHVASGLRRQVRRLTATGSAEEAEQPAPDPRLAHVREALDSLGADHREALELRLVSGLSYAEIAEALDIPIGTVRSRIHYALDRLRDRLGAEEEP